MFAKFNVIFGFFSYGLQHYIFNCFVSYVYSANVMISNAF
jgi:hypothetical protein